jgi:parallel beta-helix repeat protein
MKKSILLFIACAVSLAQCDVWDKPIIEQILKEAEEFYPIEKIMVTKYPFPNTFIRDDEILADLTNGSADLWESKCGLELSGITSGGEMRKLTAEEYTVESFDPDAFNNGSEIPVTVTLNGASGVTTSFGIAVISLSENYHTVKIAAGINNGILVPFPSAQKEGGLVTVYAYPDNGYVYKKNSISNIPPPPLELDFNYNDEAIIFTMPGGNVTLTAEFFEAAAKLETGGTVQYFETLEAAFGAINSGEEAAIIVLKDITTVQNGISVNGNVTLAAANGKEKTVKRGNADDSLFTIGGADASLTLDAGNCLGLTLDGGKDDGITANAPLVTVSGNGTLTMGDRVVLQNNKMSAGNGGGVYVNGKFTMSGSAVVKQEVYLEDKRTITISGPLTPPGGVSAQIKLANASNGTVVLEGYGYTLTADDVGKFALLDNGDTFLLHENNKGIIANLAGWTGDALYFSGGTLSYAPTLADAISGIGAGTTAAVVYIVQDEITVTNNIPVSGNITLTVMGDGKKTVKRGSNFTDGSLFSVNSNASLTLEGNGNASLVIDGGGDKNDENSWTAEAALISVNSGGALTLNDGATLQNNVGADYIHSAGVSVWSGGMFRMTGGNISNNKGIDGGGVYVNGGTFEMSGGTISGNIATANGGGIHLRDNGTFTMTGGVISGNKVVSSGWGNGGGIYQVSSTFTMSGGIIYGKEETIDESLRNTAFYSGAAFHSDGGGTFEPSTLDSSEYTINAGVITGP